MISLNQRKTLTNRLTREDQKIKIAGSFYILATFFYFYISFLTSFAYCTLYYLLHVSPLFNALSFDSSQVSRPKPIILLISQKKEKILFVVVASACLFFCGAQIFHTLSFFYFLAHSFISFIHLFSLFLSYFVVTWQSFSWQEF